MVRGHFYSILLAMHPLPGSHTGSAILSVYDDITKDYQLQDKAYKIVTDNGANMIKAFDVSLPEFSCGDADEIEGFVKNITAIIDDQGDIGQPSVEEEEGEPVSAAEISDAFSFMLTKRKLERLPCFAHTLQLVVKDELEGVKRAKILSAALSKVNKISAKAHQKRSFQEALMDTFGRTVSAQIKTRWNSQLRTIEGVLLLPNDELTRILQHKDVDGAELVLGSREICALRTLVDILRPFAEATDRIQGNKYCTTGIVALHIAGIYSSLASYFDNRGATDMLNGSELESVEFERDLSLKPVVQFLKSSLQKRFGGLLDLLEFGPICTDLSSATFGSEIYLVASFLNPFYKDYWVEEYIKPSNRDSVKSKMRAAVDRESMILREEDSIGGVPTSGEGSDSSISAQTKRKSLDSFSRPVTKKVAVRSIAAEIDEFYGDQTESDCVKFWKTNGVSYPTLQKLVDHFLSVPATEAESERVFSSSGLIMSPLRSRISSKQLSLITFLNANFAYVPEPTLRTGG